MAAVKELLLLALAILVLATLHGADARSPMRKPCPESRTKLTKCVNGHQVKTYVHFVYDRRSNSCERRNWSVRVRCGSLSRRACTCTISGDPHYNTYDDQNLHFFGKCAYLLTKPTKGSGSCRWRIDGKNQMRGGSPYTFLKEVIVYVNGQSYRLGQKRRLYVNNVFHGLPYRRNDRKGDVNVLYSGQKIVLSSSKCGFQVAFDGDADATVRVSSRYRGSLTGICGNCDGRRNDFRTASGRDVSTKKDKFALIGNSYLAPGAKANCAGPNKIRCSSRRVRMAKKYCSTVLGPVFQPCAKAGKIDLQKVYHACIMDTCAALAHPNKKLLGEARCQNYAAAAEQCRRGGFNSRSWRSRLLCPLKCPTGMVYRSNMSPCPKTCEGEFFGVKTCRRLPRAEGCACKAGLVLDGNTCVKKEDCRCLQCADLRNSAKCADWKSRGRCKSEPEVMYRYCRLTCNMCKKRKCVDLIATNICLQKRREGKCRTDSFYREFCGLTCNWKSCKCPRSGIYIKKGRCQKPLLIQRYTKKTVFRSSITGMCTSNSIRYFKPCGVCRPFSEVRTKYACDYCKGHKVMQRIIQRREGIYCKRYIKEFNLPCTCRFSNGKKRYLFKSLCKRGNTKVHVYKEKRISKNCKRCRIIITKTQKLVKCSRPSRKYNPPDRCVRSSNGSPSSYTRTICRSRAVNCECSTSCRSKSFDCSCDCQSPVGNEECEMSKKCDRVKKRLVVRYRRELLVKDKFGDGKCRKVSAVVHSYKRPCSYKRQAFFTCDKDKAGKIIGCPTTKDRKWPPRWYNYREGYLDENCTCRTKIAKKVYQENYCCCPLPFTVREPNEEYGTGKCVRSGRHYRMNVAKVSYSYNSATGECAKKVAKWREVCRCKRQKIKTRCLNKPNYGIVEKIVPSCTLINVSTPQASCKCNVDKSSRKIMCRKQPRYLKRKGKCNIKRGRALYRKVYVEVSYRRGCRCYTRVVPEEEPCRECSPELEREVIPCPKKCSSAKGRCSPNCKKYFITYRYRWNDVSKMCIRREISRIPSRCCCKRYYVCSSRGVGTDKVSVVGPKCSSDGKHWVTYTCRQSLCGKKYKKCCRRRVKKVRPVKCNVGKTTRPVKCTDGQNIKEYRTTTVTLRRCKCKKQVTVRPCKCSCPKPKVFRKCERATNTIAEFRITYSIYKCRCRRRVEAKRRRPVCEVTRRREVYNNYAECMAGKTRNFRFVRKFSRFYESNCKCKEQKLPSIFCVCKCPRILGSPKPVCDGKYGVWRWREVRNVKRGCTCKKDVRKREKPFTCRSVKDKVSVKCRKKDGVRIRKQYHYARVSGTCRCGWKKVSEERDRCNCDKENRKVVVINERSEKRPSCRRNRWFFEVIIYVVAYRNGRQYCKKTFEPNWRDITCVRNESVLPSGKCNTKTRRRRYQKLWFELHKCRCQKKVKYFYKPCGCSKSQPTTRRKIDHHCDKRGNWIITWESYRWNHRKEICERRQREERKPVYCNPSKKRVKKTDCFNGHYQITEHWSKLNKRTCTCATSRKRIVLPCVCRASKRVVKCGSKTCCRDRQTGHYFRTIEYRIRKWNNKREKCEFSHITRNRRICKCKDAKPLKPICLNGNWVKRTIAYNMILDNKRGTRICTRVTKKSFRKHECPDTVRFKTTKNRCSSRSTDTINYLTLKYFLQRKTCTCNERVIKRKPCKCWCSNRKVFKYTRCRKNSIKVRYYQVERLEGCRCKKRIVTYSDPITCRNGVIKMTRGSCNRRRNCTRPVYGWSYEPRNCKCQLRRQQKPLSYEKCGCCKKPSEVGSWFCKKGIFYRYVITRAWKPASKKCVEHKNREAKTVRCKRIPNSRRFEYGKCKKCRRLKYSVQRVLNKDSCQCEKKRTFLKIAACCCRKRIKKVKCVKNKYRMTVVTEWKLRGDRCDKSVSYSTRRPVRCSKPPRKEDGRGGRMNCIRIRYIPYAKVIDCKCHRGYKAVMSEENTGVWCCKHRPECKIRSKPYCERKSNTWYSTVSHCVIINKQCVRRTREKSGRTVTCSSKPVKVKTHCNQKSMIEVSVSTYLRAKNCACHPYDVTTTSKCGCSPPLRYIKNKGGYCVRDNTWVEEIIEKNWNEQEKVCEENVKSRKTRKIVCVKRPVQRVLPGPKGKGPCFKRAGFRYKVKNIELLYYAARRCKCVVVRRRVVQKICECPEDRIKTSKCNESTCMKRRTHIRYKAITTKKGEISCKPQASVQRLRCCCNQKYKDITYCEKKSGHYVTIHRTAIFQENLLTCKIRQKYSVHQRKSCNKRIPAEKSRCKVDRDSGIGYETITRRTQYLDREKCECAVKTVKQQYACRCPRCKKWKKTCENNLIIKRRICYRLVKPRAGKPYCQSLIEKRTQTVPCSKRKRVIPGSYPRKCSKPTYQIITIRFRRLDNCKCIREVNTKKRIRCCPRKRSKVRCHSSGKYKVKTTYISEIDSSSNNCSRRVLKTVIPIPCDRKRRYFSPWKCLKNRKFCKRRPYNYIVKEWYKIRNCKCRLHKRRKYKNMCCCLKKWKKPSCDCLSGRRQIKHYYQILKSRKNRPNTCIPRFTLRRFPKVICKKFYRAVPLNRCPPYKPGKPVPKQKFLIRRGVRKCCSCKVQKKVVQKPCRCHIRLKWNRCRRGDTYRRVYLIEGTIKYDSNGLPKCVYSPGRYLGKDYCRCVPNKANKVLRKKRCTGTEFIKTYEYKVMTKSCFRVSGIALCLRKCVTKLIDEREPIDCPQTNLLVRRECNKRTHQRDICRQVAYVKNCKCRHSTKCFKKQACECPSKSKRRCNQRTNAKEVLTTICRPVGPHCICKKKLTSNIVKCDKPRKTRVVDCELKRGYAYYHVDRIDKRIARDCTCIPKVFKRESFCRCEKDYKSKPQCIQGNTWRTVIKTYSYVGGARGCAEKVSINRRRVSCPTNPSVIKGRCDRSTSCTRDNLVIYNVLKACSCVKKSVRVQSRCINCCLHKGYSTKSICDKRRNIRITSHYKFVTKFNGWAFRLQKVRIPNYRCERRLVKRTRTPTDCPKTQVSETCNDSDGVWTKTVTRFTKSNCQCKPKTKTYSGSCRCPVSYISHRGPCRKNFRLIEWKIYPRTPNRRRKCPYKIIKKRERCNCARRENKTKRCDRKGNWRVTIYYTVFNPKSKRCVRKSSIISNERQRCPDNRYGVPAKNCSRKRTNCIKVYKDYIYYLNRRTCSCSKKVKTRKNKRCCCPKAKKVKKCVQNKFWLWTTRSYVIDEAEKCIPSTDKSTVPVECPRPYYVRSDCIGNRKNPSCGYRLLHKFHFVIKDCRCVKKQKTSRILCNNYCSLCKPNLKERRRCNKKDGGKTRVYTSYAYRLNNVKNRPICIRYESSRKLEPVACSPSVISKSTYDKCGKRTGCRYHVYKYKMVPRNCKCVPKLLPRQTRRNLKCSCECEKPQKVKSCRRNKIWTFTVTSYSLRRNRCRKVINTLQQVVECPMKPAVWVAKGRCTKLKIKMVPRINNCKCSYKKVHLQKCRKARDSCCKQPKKSEVCVKGTIVIKNDRLISDGCNKCILKMIRDKKEVVCKSTKPPLRLKNKRRPDGTIIAVYQYTKMIKVGCSCRRVKSIEEIPIKCPLPKIKLVKGCPKRVRCGRPVYGKKMKVFSEIKVLPNGKPSCKIRRVTFNVRCNCPCSKKHVICYKNAYWRVRIVSHVKSSKKCIRRERTINQKVRPPCKKRASKYRFPRNGRCPRSGFFTIRMKYYRFINCRCKKVDIKVGDQICRCPPSSYKKICSRSGRSFIGITTSFYQCGRRLSCCQKITRKNIPIKCPKLYRQFKCDKENRNEVVTETRHRLRKCACIPVTRTIVQPCISCEMPRCRIGKKVTCLKNRVQKVERWTCHLQKKPRDWRKKCISSYKVTKHPVPCRTGVTYKKTKCNPLTREQIHIKVVKYLLKCQCLKKRYTKKCDCNPCKKSRTYKTCDAIHKRWIKSTISWSHDGCKCNKKIKKQVIPIPCASRKYAKTITSCRKRKSGVGYVSIRVCRREVVNCKCKPTCYTISKVCYCKGLITNRRCRRNNTIVTTVKRLKLNRRDNSCVWQTESITRKIAPKCPKDRVTRTACIYKSRSGGERYRLVKTRQYHHRNCVCVSKALKVKREPCDCDQAWKVIKKKCNGPRRGCSRVYVLRRYVARRSASGKLKCKKQQRFKYDKCCCSKPKKTSYCDKNKCARVTITSVYSLTGRYMMRYCEKETEKSYDYPPCVKDRNIKRVKIDRSNCRKYNFMRVSYQRQVCKNCGCRFIEYKSEKRVCRCNYSFKSCKCVKKGRKQRCQHRYNRMSADRKRCIKVSSSYEVPVVCGKRPQETRVCNVKRRDSKGYVDYYYRVRRYQRTWGVNKRRNTCTCKWKPSEDTSQLCKCQPYNKEKPNDYIEVKRYCLKRTNTIVVLYKRRIRRGNSCVEMSKKKKIKVTCEISKTWRQLPDPPCPAKSNVIRKVFERSYKRNCRCDTKRKYKICRCRCPRPVLRQKCYKNAVLAIASSYKLVGCKCIRVIKRSLKRLSCPRNFYQVRKAKSPKCTEMRLRITFKKTTCTKCTKKVEKTVDHWCCPRLPPKMRKKVECDAKNAIKIVRRFRNVLVGRHHPNRICKLQESVYKKRISCRNLVRKERIMSSCLKRDGYTDKVRKVQFFSVAFNGEACECVWSRHYRWDVCGCRPSRVVIKACNHKNCRQDILSYSYKMVRRADGTKTCKESISKRQRRCGCCRRGYKKGPKCDGRKTKITTYTSFQWDYTRMVCTKKTRTKREPVECGKPFVVKRSAPNPATCTYTTRYIKNFVRKCKCASTSTPKKCFYCCRPKKVTEKRCKNHKVIVTTVSKWKPVNCKCMPTTKTRTKHVKCKKRWTVKCYRRNPRTCKQKCCKFECKVRNCKAIKSFKRTCWYRVYKCCSTGVSTLSRCDDKKRQKIYKTVWYAWKPWRCDSHSKSRKESIHCNKRLTIDEGHCNIKGKRSGDLQEILRQDVMRRELYAKDCKCREDRRVRRRICACNGYRDEEKCTGSALITYRHSWELKERADGKTYCSPVTNIITSKLTKCKKPRKKAVGSCVNGRRRVQIITEYADNCDCKENISEYEMTCSCPKEEKEKRCNYETGVEVTTTRSYVKVCKSPFSCYCKRRKLVSKKKVVCKRKKFNCRKGRAVSITYKRVGCKCVSRKTVKLVKSCKGCYDFITGCRTFKTLGYCESRPDVKRRCQKTCGLCPKPCQKPSVVEFKPERGYSIKSNKRFKKYFYIRTIRNKLAPYCMKACKKEKDCRSFDYDLRRRNCVLNRVRRDDITTRGYRWNARRQRARYNVHYTKVCQEHCKCKVKAVDNGRCTCRGIGIERWCSRKFSLLSYTKTSDGKCRLNEDSSYVSVDCDQSCVDLGDDCRKNKRRCSRDIRYARRCDRTCRPVCKCGDKRLKRVKGICMKRKNGKWLVYERIAKYYRDRCTGLCVMGIVERYKHCVPPPCDEKEIKVVGDCIKGVKIVSIYSRKRQNNGSCLVRLVRTVKEDCFKCCKELMTDVGRCHYRRRRKSAARPITHSWYVKRNGNCELKMQTRWYPCSKLACPRDFTTNGKCEFGRRLTYRVYYTLDRNRKCVRHAKAYKTYCRQRIKPECTDAYIDVLSPRQCLSIKKKGLCNSNEGSSMCARTCDLCVIKKYCTKKMGPVDLVLVVDSSGSVERVTYENYVIPYLRSIVGKMGSYVRVSIITYGSKPKTVVRLGQIKFPQLLMRAINRLEPNGGRTGTAEALYAAGEEFRQRGRRGARKVSVLITEGSNNGRISLSKAAKHLKRYADSSIVVAVGEDIREDEIKQITTDYAVHDIRLNNHRQLSSAVYKVATKVCPKGKKPKPKPKPKPNPKPAPKPKPKPKPKPVVPKYPIDLYFIVDSSFSVDKKEFLQIREFIKTYVNSITVSPVDTRVSVIQYYEKVTVAIDIEEYKTAIPLITAIESLRYYGSDRNVLGDALTYTAKLISRNDRNVPKVVIVISGESPTNGKTVKEAAPKLNYYADKVIEIGIDNRMPRTEGLLIASTPQDLIYVIETKELHDKIPTIIEKTKISGPKRRPSKIGNSQDIVFIVDSSDSIGAANWNLYIKGLLKVVTEYIHISPTDTRVALIQFSKPAQVVFGFDDNQNYEVVRRAINQLRPIHRSTYPSIGNAMKVAVKYVRKNKRPGVPISAILITASTSAPRVGIPVSKIAGDAREAFDYIIPVAIRNRVDMPDLVKLAKPDSSVIIATEELDELIPLSKRIIYYTTVKLRRVPKICTKRRRGDFIFVIGVSKKTATAKNFKTIQRFITNITTKYSISEGMSRAGVFLLGSNPAKVIGLSAYRSNIDFKAGVDRLSNPVGRSAAMVRSMDEVLKYARRSRTRKRPATMVYISDGSEIDPQAYKIVPKIAASVRKTVVLGVKPKKSSKAIMRTMVSDVQRDFIKVNRYRDLLGQVSQVISAGCTIPGAYQILKGRKYKPGVKRIEVEEKQKTITRKIVNKKITEPSQNLGKGKKKQKRRNFKPISKHRTVTIKIGGVRRKIIKNKKPIRIHYKRVKAKKTQARKKLSIIYGTVFIRGSSRRIIKKIKIGDRWFKARVLRVRRGKKYRRMLQIKYRNVWITFTRQRRMVLLGTRWYRIRVRRRIAYVRFNGRWKTLREVHHRFYIRIKQKILYLHTKSRRRSGKRLRKSKGRWRRYIRISYKSKLVKGRKTKVPRKIRLGRKKVQIKLYRKRNSRGKKLRKYSTKIKVSGNWVRFSTRRKQVRIGGHWFPVYYRRKGAGLRYRRKWYRLKIYKGAFRIKTAGKWKRIITKGKKVYIQHQGKITRLGSSLVVRSLSGKFKKLRSKKLISRRRRRGKMIQAKPRRHRIVHKIRRKVGRSHKTVVRRKQNNKAKLRRLRRQHVRKITARGRKGKRRLSKMTVHGRRGKGKLSKMTVHGRRRRHRLGKITAHGRRGKGKLRKMTGYGRRGKGKLSKMTVHGRRGKGKLRKITGYGRRGQGKLRKMTAHGRRGRHGKKNRSKMIRRMIGKRIHHIRSSGLLRALKAHQRRRSGKSKQIRRHMRIGRRKGKKSKRISKIVRNGRQIRLGAQRVKKLNKGRRNGRRSRGHHMMSSTVVRNGRRIRVRAHGRNASKIGRRSGKLHHSSSTSGWKLTSSRRFAASGSHRGT